MSRGLASASTSDAAAPGAMRAFAVAGLAVMAAAASGGALAQQVCGGAPMGQSAPTSRFLDNADGTVTDKESKLMWMRCSIGQTWDGRACAGAAEGEAWAEAQAQATELNRRGSLFYADWRLPQLRELATIAERECADPRVNLAVFPGTESRPYWTATSRPGTRDDTSAYALSFGAEGIAYRPKDEAHRVRLVRSAQ
jgi:hypothetical protein